MDHNKYMTTGEFARRMGVTKNTLFHYDNIGLFLPEIVDPPLRESWEPIGSPPTR